MFINMDKHADIFYVKNKRRKYSNMLHPMYFSADSIYYSTAGVCNVIRSHKNIVWVVSRSKKTWNKYLINILSAHNSCIQGFEIMTFLCFVGSFHCDIAQVKFDFSMPYPNSEPHKHLFFLPMEAFS